MIDTNDIRQRMTECDVSEEDILDLCNELDAARAEIERLAGKPKAQTDQDYFVVALQLISNNGDRQESTIKLKACNASSLNEALGASVKEYAYGNYHLGAWRAAHISALTADLPIPEETTVEAEVENA